MNVFIRAIARIFSFREKWNVLFNSAISSLNKTFHLSPHENILIIALIKIHYLYITYVDQDLCKDKVLHLHVCIVFLPSSPITIPEIPNCLSHKWLTFLKRCHWLVRQEYNKHVTIKGLISAQKPEQKHR